MQNELFGSTFAQKGDRRYLLLFTWLNIFFLGRFLAQPSRLYRRRNFLSFNAQCWPLLYEGIVLWCQALTASTLMLYSVTCVSHGYSNPKVSPQLFLQILKAQTYAQRYITCCGWMQILRRMWSVFGFYQGHNWADMHQTRVSFPVMLLMKLVCLLAMYGSVVQPPAAQDNIQ